MGFTRDEYRFFALAMNEDLSAVDVAGVAAAHGVPLDAYRAAHPGRSWCYELTWPTPAFGGALGACHLLDVPLTFGNFSGPMMAMLLGSSVPPEARELAEDVRKSVTNFAATGDPGWPEYRRGEALTRIWDVPSSVVADPIAASQEIWAGRV